MGKANTIKVGGKAYPCYPTMGAMLKFRNLTGKEVSEVGPNDLSLMIALCYCQTACACDAEGVDLTLELEQFANRLSPDSFYAWCAALGSQEESQEAEKKAKRP